jgi:nitrogen fixation NifU-like protein
MSAVSAELRELYQTTILDHNKKPRNFRRPEDANHQADGVNPLCGDQVTVFLTVADGAVKDVGFQGSGCAISKSAASLMTEAVKGKTLQEVQTLFERFQGLVTSDPRVEPDLAELGKLAVFAGVREVPVRVKCATLPWHTLHAAIERRETPVKTE